MWPFFRGSEQLDWHLWPRVDRVEVRFRGSKGDQYRQGAVLTRVRGATATALHLGGGAVALMVELILLSCSFRRQHHWRRIVGVVVVGTFGRKVKPHGRCVKLSRWRV